MASSSTPSDTPPSGILERGLAALRSPGRMAVAISVAAALILPFVMSDYRIFQFTLAYVYAMALLGLNILTGYNGQFSLGHGAFFAVGAYTSAIMIDQWGIPYGWTLPAAGVVCLVVGILFGIPALRIEGMYLALATLALAMATPQILKYHLFEGWTGGVQGIVLEKPGVPLGLPLNADQWLYFLALAILLLGVAVAWNLLRSRTGRALMAIRDHHMAAQSMGIDTALYKSVTFGVSAMYTGVAGALSAIVVQFVAPDSFNLFLSITLVVGIVVGGLGSISGAIYGGFFIQFIPNIADSISRAAPWAIYGVFLIGFMFVMPQGIAGFVAIVWRKVSAFRAATGEPGESSARG